MFYMYGGKIYAPRRENGALTYDIMAVQTGADNTPHIVKAGGSVKALPSGSIPMTENEIRARIPAVPVKAKRQRKAVEVSDVSVL